MIADGDSVTPEYAGRLTDGTVFDTSRPPMVSVLVPRRRDGASAARMAVPAAPTGASERVERGVEVVSCP